MSDQPQPFDTWAIVEIMGHQRYAGRVTEQTVGGCAFVRVDVPAVNGEPAFTKLFGQASIFCITPVSEDVARAAAQRTQSRPVEIYGLLASPAATERRERFGPDFLDGEYDEDDD